MLQADRIKAARALLETITPLKGDCGKRCGAACCQPDGDGQGGMLLFPGEEALYPATLDWATIEESGLSVLGRPIYFFTCQGQCPRDMRPLSCRIFPLTPYIENGVLDIRLDVRAWPVCPLMGYGIEGLSRDFAAAVRAAMALLVEDDDMRAYMETVTHQLKAFSSF